MTSVTSSTYAEAKTGVFWDVDDCPIPDGLDPKSVYEKIKSALANNGYRGEMTIMAFCDKNQFPDGPEDFESAGIKLVPAGNKRKRYRKMSDDLYPWYDYNREHEFTNLMVISRDNLDFVTPLGFFKGKGANILLAQPENANGQRWCSKCRLPLENLVAQSGEWFWETLSAGGDPITKSQIDELLRKDNTDCC